MTNIFFEPKQGILSSEDETDIKQAILNAELDTSGEIRVHVENTCEGDVLQRASQVFDAIEMKNTTRQNGVLFYLAVKSRKFAIIGDRGVNKKVPDKFWNDLKMDMLGFFRSNQFAEGLIYGIGRTGEYLKRFFPYIQGDVNELPDEVSYS
jgi:uncharacterized membrane protein